MPRKILCKESNTVENKQRKHHEIMRPFQILYDKIDARALALPIAGSAINGMPAREINALAEEHLKANVDRTLAELKNHPLIVQCRAEWQRHQERRSRRACKSPK